MNKIERRMKSLEPELNEPKKLSLEPAVSVQVARDNTMRFEGQTSQRGGYFQPKRFPTFPMSQHNTRFPVMANNVNTLNPKSRSLFGSLKAGISVADLYAYNPLSWRQKSDKILKVDSTKNAEEHRTAYVPNNGTSLSYPGENEIGTFTKREIQQDWVDRQNTTRFTLMTDNLGTLNHESQSLFSSLKASMSAVADGYGYYVSPWVQPEKIWKILKGNREIGFLLPLHSRDLGQAGNTVEENSLTCKDFMCYVRDSVLNIPPTYRWALLLACGSYLSSQMKNSTSPFENFHLVKTINTQPQQLLYTFGEAYDKSSEEITDTAMFMICIILILLLSYPLHPGVQMILRMLLLIPALSFFPNLARKASKTGVACGTIKLPLFWFTVLGAVGLSILLGLIITLAQFCIRRWLSDDENPKVGDVDDAGLDRLAEALQG